MDEGEANDSIPLTANFVHPFQGILDDDARSYVLETDSTVPLQ